MNGFDDMQTSIRYYTPFENAQIVIGQFKSIIEPFSGFLHNMVLFFYPAVDSEIMAMKKVVQEQMQSALQVSPTLAVSQKSVYIENVENYLQSKKLPIPQFIELGVNQGFFDTEDGVADGGDLVGGVEADPIELMAQIFDNPDNTGIRDKVTQVIQPGKYEYLMKSCAIIVNGDLNFGG